MKKSLLILVLSLLTQTLVWAQSNVVDQVVWVVGSEPILMSDVEESRIAMEMHGQVVDNPYCSIPEQIAIQKLFVHQAELDSIDVSESAAIQAANDQINAYIQQFGSKENVEYFAHKTIPQLREMYKEQARMEQKVEGVKRNLRSGIRITPAEVREYYKHMNPDSLPLIPTKVEVQIITQQPRYERAEIERVENKLKEIAHRVNAGETTFAIQARMWSQDPVSAARGGECGMTGRNSFVPEFSNVAFSLTDPKKVSKIVKTEFGYHIIQLIEKKGDMANVRHILIKPEASDSAYTASTERLDSIAAAIRGGKVTFEEAALRYSSDKDTRSNRGVMANREMQGGMMVGMTSRFEMRDLPSQIALVVDTMQVGQVSQAFRYENEKGQQLTAIVKLKNRIEAHPANPVEDYQILRDIVYNERAQRKLNDWIKEKIKTTYIRISPEWRSCEFQYDGWIKQ